MESNNLTEKLNTFTSLVLKDAEQKREKLLENVQNFREQKSLNLSRAINTKNGF